MAKVETSSEMPYSAMRLGIPGLIIAAALDDQQRTVRPSAHVDHEG